MRRSPLHPLVQPNSIVLFGASPTPGTLGNNLAANLLKSGFRGMVHLVNPRHAAIGEHPCHPSLEAVNQPVDLALIATPAAAIPDLLRECGKHHVKAAVIYSADLTGNTEKIVEAARSAGIRLLGPGALGFIRPHHHLNTSPFQRSFPAGNLAFVSQSDAVCAGILDWVFGDDFALSAVFSPGDESDLGLPEILDFLASDPATESILLHLKDIPDSRHFLSALRAAARAKPVVTVKANRQGRHDHAFDAALRRVGALRVSSVGDLFSAARALTSQQRPRGNRLAIIANGSGPAIIAADHAQEHGIQLGSLSASTHQSLQDALGRSDPLAIPLNLLFDASPACFQRAISICAGDPGVDAILVIAAPNSLYDPETTASAIIEAAAPLAIPVLACILGESSVRQARRKALQAGLPIFRTPESAVTAFSFMVEHTKNQALLLETPGAQASYQCPDLHTARTICAGALESLQPVLSPHDAQRLLQAFHITSYPGLKADSERGHRQLALSIRRDAVFGPVIELSPGGDSRHFSATLPVALPPLNNRLINDYLHQDAIARLLAATPTLPAVAIDPLRRLLLHLSELACELPWIDTLVIDPLVADDYTVRAGTAQITLCPGSAPGSRYQHMAIRPYPLALESSWTDKQGDNYRIRPIRPEDAEGFQTFVRSLSHQSRYLRFFGTLRELSASQLARHTQIDYDREMVLVAVRPTEDDTEIIIGEAFFGVLADGESGEFGVVVADHMAGRGIGATLMGRLSDTAREWGLKQLTGEVLAENEPMQALMESLGFSICMTDNPEILELRQRL